MTDKTDKLDGMVEVACKEMHGANWHELHELTRDELRGAMRRLFQSIGIEALVRDAERLDWLVAMWVAPAPFTQAVAGVIESFRCGDAEKVRAAIDAAMEASSGR